ncbi:MAG: zinc metallopeptidase [Bacilli bacterium]|nr:zinc metallopeptidase [Bacilli bacterium]
MDILLIIIALVITSAAQMYVSSSYNKYNKVSIKKNISGFEVARAILDKHGLNNVYVTETAGVLSDHYDPSRKVVKLSSDIFHGNSIASCSVAAHEVGHAIQDKENYKFMRFRSAIIPIVNLSSYGGYISILIGVMFGSIELVWIGIAFEIIILIFQLVTLPVEFDASKRATEELEKLSILTKEEVPSSQKMLRAAAYTYVASVISAILQILRLILIYGRSDRD